MLPGEAAGPARDRFVRSTADARRCPSSDDDIAFAPVTQLSRWIEHEEADLRAADQHLSRPHRALRSEAPLRHHAHADVALAQAKQADAEIAAGKYRGPLHGIPYGVKDLLDTAGIRDDLRRGAVPEPRADGGLRGGAAAATTRARC